MLMTPAQKAHVAVALRAHARQLHRDQVANGYDHSAMITWLNAEADKLLNPAAAEIAHLPEPTKRDPHAAERMRRYRARKKARAVTP
jgi:hypothetical protein